MAPRRRRPPLLALLGLVVAVLVIVVLALPGSESSSDQQSYLDVVRAQLQLSSQQGTVVRDIRAHGASFDRTTLSQRANDLVSGSAAVSREVGSVGAPGSLASAARSLNQSLSMRAQAAVSLRDGLQASLGGAPTNQTTDLLARAGQKLITGDDDYGRFLLALSRSQAASISVPQYRWVLDRGDWDSQSLDLYVLGLRLSPSLAPRHDVAVVLVSTQPSPTSYLGQVAILGLTRQVTVGVVVANTGNVTEHGVPVVASIGGGPGQSARATVDLDPGQRRAVDLGGLPLNPGRLYSLTVTAGPVPGEAARADNQQTMALAVSG